jgi:hypothetical protein
MAITVINLSDPVSTWVSKTNTVASNLGDLTLLTIGGSDIVTAINRVDSNLGTISALSTGDKSDLVAAINEVYDLALRGNEALNDSDEIIGLFSSSASISLDSSLGQYSIINNSITFDMLQSNIVKSSNFNNSQTLLIKNSSGTTVKTMYSPGN